MDAKPSEEKIDIWLIDAFSGPRHERLKEVWREYARRKKEEVNIKIFPNEGAQKSHARALQEIWAKAQKGSDRVIITEFDCLPLPEMSRWPRREFSTQVPVHTSRYCTREPISKRLHVYECCGPWFVRLAKHFLHGKLYFGPGGPFNDPGNVLDQILRDSTDGKQCVKFLPVVDCYPEHYGIRVGEVCEHLFWSRHYNDPPGQWPAGFDLDDILCKVDKAIEKWWHSPAE